MRLPCPFTIDSFFNLIFEQHIKYKTMYLKSLLLLVGILINGAFTQAQEKFKGETVEFNSTDGLVITADVYMVSDVESPMILLFHQARFSRGEYREIAPKLNALGYACMAVDQRSGDKVNGVINQTHIMAEKNGLATKYSDAYPDLVASLNYAKETYPNRKIIIWGSSYSSSLVFILAGENPDDISGVLSFSPGEYFEYEGKKIVDFSSKVKCPVFITSAKNEHGSWKEIYAAVPNPNKQSFLPTVKGFHGSKALWKEHPGNDDYWKAVVQFLNSLK
jgi:dienelactone hydrolase